MWKFWRIVRWPLLLLLPGLLYAGYRIVWGQPFTLHQLADRQAIGLALGDPELLTNVGIVDGSWLDRHSGKLTPVGPERRAADLARDQRYIGELRRFDRSRLSRSDRITWDVLDSLWSDAVAFGDFDYVSSEGLYPLNQMNGSQVNLMYLLQSGHVLGNRKLAENYVRRLEAAGAKLDAVAAEVRRQAGQGVVMPLALLERSLASARDTIAPTPEQNPLVLRLGEELPSLDDVDAGEREALIRRATQALREGLYPAYQRQIELLESQRAAASMQAAGIGRLPDGAALYAQYLRRSTTTDYTADQIHDIGLAEVARIEAEMERLFAIVGMTTGSIGERYDALAKRPDQLFEDSDAGREQILARYRELIAEAEALMPQYFSKRPEGALRVQRVPMALQAGAAAGSYWGGAVDGSRPGTFYVNLRSVAEQPRFRMKTLAYHEGVPGHHFQLDIALRLPHLPLIRQQSPFTAYAEGWALYTERLMAEIGMYKDDPLGDLGRLSDEMLRAVRLVVDTGLHARGWTRDQAIAYMRAKSGQVESDAIGEVDRYMAMPGQACSYMVGQMKILELRERARQALGIHFDLRAFHDVMLGEGAMPLTALEQLVDEWIAEERGKAS